MCLVNKSSWGDVGSSLFLQLTTFNVTLLFYYICTVLESKGEPPTNMGRLSCQLGVSTALVAQEKVLFLAIHHMHKHCF